MRPRGLPMDSPGCPRAPPRHAPPHPASRSGCSGRAAPTTPSRCSPRGPRRARTTPRARSSSPRRCRSIRARAVAQDGVRADGGHRRRPRARSTRRSRKYARGGAREAREGARRAPASAARRSASTTTSSTRASVYHVQTEDSGLDKPHVITHLFADGGRIIKSHKRSYASEVNRDDVALFVRALMKGQQMEMVLGLREGSSTPSSRAARPGGDGRARAPAERRGAARRRPRRTPPPKRERRDAAVRSPAKPSRQPPRRGSVSLPLHVLRSLAPTAPSVRAAGRRRRSSARRATSRSPASASATRARRAPWRERPALARRSRGRQRRLPPHPHARSRSASATSSSSAISSSASSKTPVLRRPPGPGPTYCYSSPVRPSSFRVRPDLRGRRRGRVRDGARHDALHRLRATTT